jgi:hypothetical protein
MFATKKFTTIVVDCSTTVLQNKLPLDQIIEGSNKIRAIESYRVTNVSNSPLDGSATVNETVFNKSFLVLLSKGGNEEVISKIPLTDLCKADNNGNLFELDINGISMQKSYILVPELTATVGTEKFLLGFHYEK